MRGPGSTESRSEAERWLPSSPRLAATPAPHTAGLPREGPQWPIRPFPLTPLMSTPGCSSEVCSECLSCSQASRRRPPTSSLGPRPQPHVLSGSGLPGTSRVSRRCIPVSLAPGWAQRGSGEQVPESSCSHRTVLCMGARPGACT